MSSSSLMSSALAIFWFPPILLLNPLQFSPMSRNIPGCFVFGAVPCTWSSPSSTASITLLCSFSAASSSFLPLLSSCRPSSVISLIICSKSSSCNLPCFLNRSARIRSCSIMVECFVVLNLPLIPKFFSLTHVVNSCRCLLAACP